MWSDKKYQSVNTARYKLDCQSVQPTMQSSIPGCADHFRCDWSLIINLRSFALYHCLGMYRSNQQFLAKVKASGTGKLLDSLPRECVVAKHCFSEYQCGTALMRRVNFQHHHHGLKQHILDV